MKTSPSTTTSTDRQGQPPHTARQFVGDRDVAVGTWGPRTLARHLEPLFPSTPDQGAW